MKKRVVLLAALVALLFPATVKADDIMDITRAAGYDVLEINRPKSSIAIDGKTGEILWQDNSDALRDPASMSKVMTLYLVYEAIAEGRLTEETIITATETDQAIAQIYAISNNKIVAGVDYTVGELITMTAVPSSNATTVMLANYLSNNDADAFLDLMNAKAKELGMTNTTWNNASGAAAVAFNGYYLPTRYPIELPNETTARDLAILVYNFVKKYPAILNHTKDPVVTVKAGTPYEETFDTYNYSLPGAKYGIEGVNGLKTGSSPSGAFNYMATVNRKGQEVIAVIMGVGDWSDQDGEYYRHPFGNAIIEKAYADYETRLLLKAGEQEINGQKYELKEDFYGTLKKGSTPVYAIDEQGNLSLDNGLESVSPNITSSQKVTKVENPVAKVIKKVIPGSADQDVTLFDLFFKKGLILIPLLAILLGIVAVEVKRKRK